MWILVPILSLYDIIPTCVPHPHKSYVLETTSGEIISLVLMGQKFNWVNKSLGISICW